MKSEAKVASDGTQAVVYGALRIMSGKYRTTLCVAHCKMSEGAQNAIANAMFDPIYQQHIGLDDVSAAALQAFSISGGVLSATSVTTRSGSR